jgi:hypothetical protein
MARLLTERRSGDAAWLVIIGGAIAYEFAFDDLLTDSADRARARHPLLTRLIILAIAGHLTAWLPPWADLLAAKNAMHRLVVYLGKRDPRVRFIASPLAILLLAVASRREQ